MALNKLLVHHHSLVFIDGKNIWFQSFIGSWINELSNHFEEITFIAEISKEKIPALDYLISKSNVKVLSFGTRGVNSSKQKKNAIKLLGFQSEGKYDHLIIRGVTPRQFQVFNSFKSISISFLMVGSFVDSRPEFKFNRNDLLVMFLYYLRIFQLKWMSKSVRFFANSPQIVNEFKSELGIDAQFIPTNTIRKTDFINYKFRGISKEPNLLFCGRVVKEKGIEELIDSIALLNKKGLYCHLKIVGGIDQNYRNLLMNKILKLKLGKQISFEGFKVFGEELFTYYRNADLYVLPSYHEGFPHSIWEASCTCTPIITTKVGGIGGIVSSKEVIFIEVKSVTSIVDSILNIVINTNSIEPIVKNAYNLSKLFTIEECVNSLKQKINFI